MRNPWVHDDGPDSASIHESRAKLIGALLWGVLIVGVGATLVVTGDGITDLGGVDSAWPALLYGFGALVSLLALPLLLKLAAFSRTLAGIVLLLVGGLIARFAVAESERIAAATDAAAAALEPIAELLELLDVLTRMV